MSDETITMLAWAVTAVFSFWCGWGLCWHFERFKAGGVAAAAAERANEERAHGFQQGYVVGIDIGVRAGAQRAQRFYANSKILSELAARRFVAGGMAPHE